MILITVIIWIVFCAAAFTGTDDPTIRILWLPMHALIVFLKLIGES